VAYVRYRPVEPLSRFVDYLWWLSDVPVHLQERIVPTGTQELVINLDADRFDIGRTGQKPAVRRFSGAMVSGAYSRYFVIDTRAHASLLGVHFKPGGARALLGPPLGELADGHVDLELLWGRSARELRERLCAIADPELRLRHLEKELAKRVAGAPGPSAEMVAAVRSLARQRPVSEVASELGLSDRRFIELFTAEVGMTPKLYGRVQRFQRALSLARNAPPDWAALALKAGYCDQPHLIRDFVSFSGFSPTELLRHTGPNLKENHLGPASKIHPRRP